MVTVGAPKPCAAVCAMMLPLAPTRMGLAALKVIVVLTLDFSVTLVELELDVAKLPPPWN